MSLGKENIFFKKRKVKSDVSPDPEYIFCVFFQNHFKGLSDAATLAAGM